MATDVSSGKFKHLILQLNHWNRPASVAACIKNELEIDEFFCFTLGKREDIQQAMFHLVLEKTKLDYAHNVIRNLDLEMREFDYFLATDSDLILMPKGCHVMLFEVIKQKLQRQKRNFSRGPNIQSYWFQVRILNIHSILYPTFKC